MVGIKSLWIRQLNFFGVVIKTIFKDRPKNFSRNDRKILVPTMAIEFFGCLSNNNKSFSIVILEVTKFVFNPFITKEAWV